MPHSGMVATLGASRRQSSHRRVRRFPSAPCTNVFPARTSSKHKCMLHMCHKALRLPSLPRGCGRSVRCGSVGTLHRNLTQTPVYAGLRHNHILNAFRPLHIRCKASAPAERGVYGAAAPRPAVDTFEVVCPICLQTEFHINFGTTESRSARLRLGPCSSMCMLCSCWITPSADLKGVADGHAPDHARACSVLGCARCDREFPAGGKYTDLTLTAGLSSESAYQEQFWGGTETFRCAPTNPNSHALPPFWTYRPFFHSTNGAHVVLRTSGGALGPPRPAR